MSYCKVYVRDIPIPISNTELHTGNTSPHWIGTGCVSEQFINSEATEHCNPTSEMVRLKALMQIRTDFFAACYSFLLLRFLIFCEG